MKYSVINLKTDETMGEFETLTEARGAVRYDRLSAWAIWQDENVLIEKYDPYWGGDERAQQGTGNWEVR